MGKTFDQSLIDVANIPMSAIDPSDMEDTSSEEFIQMRRVQQGCHNELVNREEFPFMVKTLRFKTIADVEEYKNAIGKIESVFIEDEERPLEYENYLRFKAETKGKPTKFGVVYNPEKIILYPTPDKVYNITVNYRDTRTVSTNDEAGYDIKVGSTLIMPERFQHLYFDCLEYFVLATNMRKQSNPRWQPTLQIAEERWQIFLRGSQTTDSTSYFII